MKVDSSRRDCGLMVTCFDSNVVDDSRAQFTDFGWETESCNIVDMLVAIVCIPFALMLRPEQLHVIHHSILSLRFTSKVTLGRSTQLWFIWELFALMAFISLV